MAPVSENPISSIISMKNLLISITIVLLAMILKLYVPIVLELVVYGVPTFWTTLGTWFTPPYLYVVVNVIIIAIAASSRLQQKMDDGASEIVTPLKIQSDLQKENSVESKTEFEAMKPSRHLEGVKKEVKIKKKPKDLEVKSRKQFTEAKPAYQAMESSKMYVHMEGEQTEVNARKKSKGSESKFEATKNGYRKAEEVEVKKKKLVEFKQEFEEWKPEKYGRFEAKNIKVKNNTEASAKEAEDKQARSKSMGNLKPNSIQNPMEYSFSEKKGLVDRLGHQAGKQVRASEEEENDTLDGTWKMIMERSRIHDAGLQEASLKTEKFKQSNHLRSPS